MRGFLGWYLFWPWFSGMGKLCQFRHLLEMRVDDIGEWGVGKKVGCEIFEPGDIVGRTMRTAFNEQQPILDFVLPRTSPCISGCNPWLTVYGILTDCCLQLPLPWIGDHGPTTGPRRPASPATAAGAARLRCRG